MKTYLGMTTGVLLGLSAGLQAGFETPGPGPNLDLDYLTGEDSERLWAFWTRAYLGYDDNVQLVPNGAAIGADEESWYLGVTAEGVYRFWESGNLDAGAAIRVDQTVHFEDSGGAVAPDEWDATVLEPALFLNWSGDRWYGRASYSFRWEDADAAVIGVDSHNLGVMLGTDLTGCVATELSWVHGWDDFGQPGAGVTDRDGERDRVSLSFISPGSASSPRTILRFSYLDNDADGSNFAYDGYEVMLRVEGGITDNIDGAVQVSYADLDYDTGARNEQEVFSAAFQLVYRIDQNWSADVYYSYLDIDSNAAFFSGDRNNVGMGLRYDF